MLQRRPRDISGKKCGVLTMLNSFPIRERRLLALPFWVAPRPVQRAPPLARVVPARAHAPETNLRSGALRGGVRAIRERDKSIIVY